MLLSTFYKEKNSVWINSNKILSIYSGEDNVFHYECVALRMYTKV